MEETKRQLPNVLTVFRIVLAFVCVYFAFNKMWTPSLIVFLVAGFTDFLDGYLARKWNTVSNFGKVLDPIADKLLIVGVLLAFSLRDIVPFLFTAIIAFREILLTVIRLMLVKNKVIIASVSSGKFKTFLQGGGLITIYLILIYKKVIQEYISALSINWIIYSLLIVVVFVTVYSGVEIIINAKKSIQKLLRGLVDW